MSSTTTQNNVNHPSHYTSHPSGIECIQIARHYDFDIGNVFKYIWRAGLKKDADLTDIQKEIEDLEKAAASEKEARKKVGYLKALETVSENWKAAGVDIGNWLGVLSPKKAKLFTDYMEYRFSQGDYSSRYTIDTFIKDFGEMQRQGYSGSDIEADFSDFLNNRILNNSLD